MSAFVNVGCQSCVVHRPSCVVCHQQLLQMTSNLAKLGRKILKWPSLIIVQMVPVHCSNKLKKTLRMKIKKNSSETHDIWYVA